MQRLIPLALAGGMLLGAAFRARAQVQVGETAPDFALLDVAGNTHSLSGYRGRVVLIAFIGYN